MKKIKKWITKQTKKMMRRLKNWIIKKIKQAFESFNGFIAKQTWVIKMFALIGGGYVLYLSGSVFIPYVSQSLDEKFTKVIVIENPAPQKEIKKEEEGIEIKTIIEDVTEVFVPRNSIEEAILKTFPEEPEVMLATFKTESGLNLRAKGWNCYYHNIEGKRYSKACDIADRKSAWSVDCGIAQINTIGKVCPSELFELEPNLKVARKIYETQGKEAWVAYKTNRHKKYL